MIFQQISTYRGFTFVNVESGYEEIANDVEIKQKDEDINRPSIPEEEITNFCLWLKEHTKPFVGKVTISKRIKSTPAVLYGQVSANMRMIMTMMQTQAENPEEAAKALEAMSHD